MLQLAVQVVLLVLVLVHLRCLLLLPDVDGVATFFMLSWKAAADDDDDGTTAKAARHTATNSIAAAAAPAIWLACC